MSIEQWDPFQRLDEFHKQTASAFDELLADVQGSDTSEQAIAFQPEVDLVETPTEFRFYLSIPGLVEDDIVVDIDGWYLAIRGERQPLYDADRKAQLQEWRYGYFERRFKLTSNVSPANIRGGYDAGVLTIVVEKLKSDSGANRRDDSSAPHFDSPDEWMQA